MPAGHPVLYTIITQTIKQCNKLTGQQKWVKKQQKQTTTNKQKKGGGGGNNNNNNHNTGKGLHWNKNKNKKNSNRKEVRSINYKLREVELFALEVRSYFVLFSVSICHMLSALVGPSVENGHWLGSTRIRVHLRVRELTYTYMCGTWSCDGKARREPNFVRVSHSFDQSKLPL